MREMKFRAWNVDEKRFIQTFEEIGFDGQISLWSGGSDDEITLKRQFDGFILMQYTGLKDKNGVEIYEGDIFEFEGEKAIVKWGDAAFVAEWIEDLELGDVPLHAWAESQRCEIEVIGNVSENPELLDAAESRLQTTPDKA